MVTLTDKQNDAVKNIVAWYKAKKQQIFYLAGYAGTGKSTLLKEALEQLEGCGARRVYTAAYTGKAALVMRRKGAPGAMTIHSLIYTPVEDEETHEVEFVISEESPARNADLIVLDEVSMLSREMAEDLISFEKPILVMGDPGQLPPVKGQGYFTDRKPDVFLDEIHRQALDSPIIELATWAREGRKIPVGYSKGNVKVIPAKGSMEEILSRDTQTICGLNRVRYFCNQRIRKDRGFEGEIPLAGERIICCRNNKINGLINGLMGELVDIANDNIFGHDVYMITAKLEDVGRVKEIQTDPYLFRNNFNGGRSEKIYQRGLYLDEFDLGYAITAHKAQGSSWPHVTIIDDSAAFRSDAALWKYTSLTRAEEGLTLLTR